LVVPAQRPTQQNGDQAAGAPCQRLCQRLLLDADRTRLLGLLAEPAVPERAPRILGLNRP